MLASLADVKAYLGIDPLNTQYDVFLTQQINLLTETIEGYCGRKFTLDDYVQTFYREDYKEPVNELPLFHYPVSSVSSVSLDGEATTNFRIHYPTGYLSTEHNYFDFLEKIEVEYTAGYGTVPSPVLHVFYSIIEANYNKKVSGVAINFGTDVQRISISGVMSIDFDYSLDSNQRSNAYGTILGNFINVLDPYRSERAIIGSGKIKYVEEA